MWYWIDICISSISFIHALAHFLPYLLWEGDFWHSGLSWHLRYLHLLWNACSSPNSSPSNPTSCTCFLGDSILWLKDLDPCYLHGRNSRKGVQGSWLHAGPGCCKNLRERNNRIVLFLPLKNKHEIILSQRWCSCHFCFRKEKAVMQRTLKDLSQITEPVKSEAQQDLSTGSVTALMIFSLMT